MTSDKKNQTRRKFISWGVASAALIAAVKFFKTSPSTQPKTVKMLTQDGKLVEVDINAISKSKKKITNSELQNWVKK